MTEDLKSIAQDTKAPAEVREAVIEAYLVADRPDALMEIARSDPDAHLRAKAIEALGRWGDLRLRQLWSTERDPAVRRKLLEGFGWPATWRASAKAARDQRSRHATEGHRGLGIADGDARAKTLRQLYGELQDTDDKRHVAEASHGPGRREDAHRSVPRRARPPHEEVLVQQLSVMDDPEASRVLLDLLGDTQ
jgi:hypothetical protein